MDLQQAGLAALAQERPEALHRDDPPGLAGEDLRQGARDRHQEPAGAADLGRVSSRLGPGWRAVLRVNVLLNGYANVVCTYTK